MKTPWRFTLAVLLTGLLAGPAAAKSDPQFDRMIVFGDSLSDPGNIFFSTGLLAVPPYRDTHDELRVPGAPYATHHFSNGHTWIEQLARELRRVKDAQPVSKGTGGLNFAFGGARAAGTAGEMEPPTLGDQVDLFVDAGGGALFSGDPLVVIVGGGNDLRDALGIALLGGDPTPVLAGAAGAIAGRLAQLDGLGGRKFLVGLGPNIGRTPAIGLLDDQLTALGLTVPGQVKSVAEFLSGLFNTILQGQLATLQDPELEPSLNPDTVVARLDLFAFVSDATDDPASVGLTVADRTCVSPQLAPFHCSKPNEFLFWDGIHPTRAGHAVLMEAALESLIGTGLVSER